MLKWFDTYKANQAWLVIGIGIAAGAISFSSSAHWSERPASGGTRIVDSGWWIVDSGISYQLFLRCQLSTVNVRTIPWLSSSPGVTALDIRFPTSRQLDGSDAMNPDPDYSAAYVILKTDHPGRN